MRATVLHLAPYKQRGAVLIFLVLTLVLGAAAIGYGLLKSSRSDIDKERITAAALAQAKAGLIGNAISVVLSATPAATDRPGDLPCPDTNDDGAANGGCGNSTVTAGQAVRIGRLPWKTLGLPDLRDGDGERLWYAVSNNFKNSTRTTCTAAAPHASTCLNSDTLGTITIRDSVGNIVLDATSAATGGAIAVIFAPGSVLRRQDGVIQNRSCVVGTQPFECSIAGVCNTTSAPKCNPTNYLDIFGTEDNASFIDGSIDGFINGIVRDASENVIVNDRLMVISYQDIMPQIENRVLREVSKCFTDYANANFGRYPWAVPVINTTMPLSGGIGTLFGRIPDRPLSQTELGTVSITDPTAPVTALQAACSTASPALCMSRAWPISCNLPYDPTANSWWNNWKLQVFYGLADAYKPQIVYSQPTPGTVILGSISIPSGCPACLTVNPPSPTNDKKFVVIAAGRRLAGIAGGQPRSVISDRQLIYNYLEGENNNLDVSFAQQSSGPVFNDIVLYK